MNEEDNDAKRRSLPKKQIKISIQLWFHDIVWLCICLYSVDVLCIIEFVISSNKFVKFISLSDRKIIRSDIFLNFLRVFLKSSEVVFDKNSWEIDLVIKNVKEQLCQTINYVGKIQFSQPWRGLFTCSNSRLTTRHPRCSNGTFRSIFIAW